MDSKEKVEVLVSCFDAFKKGELNNEPARLLCERILEDLEREEFECSDPDDSKAVVQAWFDECYYDDLGASGDWGVVVTDDEEDTFVVYTTSSESTWVNASQLLELAVVSSESGNPAPLPDWHERPWAGITQEVAESMVEEMDEDEVVRLLEQNGISASDGDEPIYYVKFQPYDDPREALLEAVTNKSDIDRARILEYA
ncbi:hypothetical protein CGK74_11945 [Thauera propionica]|uniref:Uncharacterized protein n=1 Tax=Thauera propionica TaxID=2019431 RepID=A0A235EXY8_9RHOO|nr:hypothetical protein [Thauera propionica]OYD53653.1 hypothetical protein CGK74_11945 [Thauera propionica]